MDRNRIIAMLMFSFSASIVWFLFKVFVIGGELFNQEAFLGLGYSVLAAAVVTFFISPRIYKKERRKRVKSLAAFHGFSITFFSVLLGSMLFVLAEFTIPDIREESLLLNTSIFVEFVNIWISIFFVAIILMSPGLLLGAATGVVYLKLIKRRGTVK